MEILIRTQDKLQLVNYNNNRLYVKVNYEAPSYKGLTLCGGDKTYHLCINAGNDVVLLGEYKTEQQVIEELDKFQKFLLEILINFEQKEYYIFELKEAE